MIAESSDLLGGPFDTVFDVGGNVGDFAAEAVEAWPDARVLSFEPIPALADVNAAAGLGKWDCYTLAISRERGELPLRVCTNQHSASTMMLPGSARAEHFGIVDHFETISVDAVPLDDLTTYIDGRLLVKIDVEGHEADVIAGGHDTLWRAETVICEVQNDPSIFLGAPTPAEVDEALRGKGLAFAGVTAALTAPGGRVLQFDGVWRRDAAKSRRKRPLRAVR